MSLSSIFDRAKHWQFGMSKWFLFLTFLRNLRGMIYKERFFIVFIQPPGDYFSMVYFSEVVNQSNFSWFAIFFLCNNESIPTNWKQNTSITKKKPYTMCSQVQLKRLIYNLLILLLRHLLHFHTISRVILK